VVVTVHYIDNYQTNSVVHGMNTSANTSSIDPEKRVSFTPALRYLTVCPPGILKLKHEKPKFKVALKEFIIAPTFYPLHEFLSISQIAFPFQHQ
jgi:hypothetical protein